MRSPEGFTEFVTASSPRLKRTAWLMTGDAGKAEELVQEALAKAWRHWAKVCAAESPEAYVRRIMVNQQLSWWRRMRVREVLTDTLPERSLADPTAASDLREVLRSALQSLPPQQRAVVVLRHFEDLTEQQTAELLGCSIGTVKTHNHRAMVALRNHPELADRLPVAALKENRP